MDLQEILRQPEGFTPPSVTVTIEKVFPYKAGEGQSGPYSFQDVKTNGGYIKLKNLMRELPANRVGQTVTIRAKQSQQHGLTGLKVSHEQYNNKTYDKLIVTPSAIWEWGAAASSGNGATPNGHASAHSGVLSHEAYTDHLRSCAELAAVIGSDLSLDDAQALQACFATICIDTKNRGIVLPKPKTLPGTQIGHSEPPEDGAPLDEPWEDDGVPF